MLTSNEQVPSVVIIRLKTGKTTIPGVVVCRVYGVWWFPAVVRIRLYQPPAGDWLAGAWAELGKILIPFLQQQQTNQWIVRQLKHV